MYYFSRALGVLALALAVILPSLAQDAKKDPAKPGVDKKADADKKADPAEKKTDKAAKKTDKAAKEKKDQPPEEKVVYGQYVANVKLKQVDANSQKDFAIELLLPDPVKVFQVEQWKAQEIFNISRQTNVLNRQRAMANYQMQLAQKNVMSPKDFQVRAADDIKVRTNFPPTEYDDKGNLKRWTAKELKALKGNSKLPGYPAEYDALRPGQIIDVYMAKQSLPTKNTPLAKNKAKLKVEEDAVEPDNRPKVVMIVIKLDAQPAQR
jgi:hypothetical protein